jgi:uncharacterized protein
MNPQDQQVIESLFQRIQQGAAQAGPRDPEAEGLIQQKLQGFPGGAYYLAQALVVQERALQQAEQRINALQQQAGGASAGFAGPPPGYQQAPTPPPYQPQYAQPQYAQPRGSGAGGFLAGAGQMALGIGGGILVAEAATSLARDVFGGGGFGGGFGGFGGSGGQEAAFERGYEAGQDNPQQQGYEQQQLDYGQQQQQDYGQQDATQLDSYQDDQGDWGDDGGGFDDGGGDDGGGW